MNSLLIVSVFGKVNDDTNDRVNSLHDYLSFHIKIVTTDFSHRDKQYRIQNLERNADLIHVSPYKKDLSVFRIISHLTFALKLFFYLLKNGKTYDGIYCITPTPSSAFICAVYKIVTSHKLFIIDVIDLWPESLIPISKRFKWISPLLLPWKWLSIFAYKRADAIIGATQEYQTQAAQFNRRAFSAFYPLGIDAEKAYYLRANSKIIVDKPSDEIWIAYAGNLGAAYDFDSMIDAFILADNKSFNYKIRFILIGGGNRKGELNAKLQLIKDKYIITGNMEYMDYLSYLSKCDIGFNIFLENSKVIESYKFNDYIVSGLYIINNLQGETSELIDFYNIGINVIGGNDQLGNHLIEVLNNWKTIKDQQAGRCRRIINERLSKNVIYNKLNSDLVSLTNRE